jgi:hypothetical protein
MSDETGQNTSWYYNLSTGAVEPEGRSKAKDLLGPYPSPEAAAHALESFKEREDRLEAEDRAWAEGTGDGEGTPVQEG